MDAISGAAKLIVGGLAILSTTGCSAGTAVPAPNPSPSPSPTAAISPSPSLPPIASPDATASPIRSPIAYGPVAVIEGTADCSFGESTTTTDPSGVQHIRASVTCVATFNDPRASGTYSGTWDADAWGVPPGNMALVQWEDARITNAGGSWEGRQTGVYSTARGDTIAGWYVGTGGYAGLTLFELTTGGGPWTIEGQIFPGKPPTP